MGFIMILSYMHFDYIQEKLSAFHYVSYGFIKFVVFIILKHVCSITSL